MRIGGGERGDYPTPLGPENGYWSMIFGRSIRFFMKYLGKHRFRP